MERIKPTQLNGVSKTDQGASSVWQAWEESLYQSNLRVQDGENYSDLITRVNQAIEYINDRPEPAIVIVTHGFFLRTLMARILLDDLMSGLILKKVQQNTATQHTGITSFNLTQEEKRTRWKLLKFNDCSHLKALN